MDRRHRSAAGHNGLVVIMVGQPPNLMTPMDLREIRVRNRIAISPMQQFMADAGMPSDWHLVHLGQFAMGHAGVVFTEAMAVDPRGRISYSDMGIWSQEQAQALRRITD